MTENVPTQFRTVMRGYDPAEVDKFISSMGATVAAAEKQADALASKVEQLSKVAAQSSAKQAVATPPAEITFTHLGERIGKILTLADQEAKAIRDSAEKTVADKLAEHDAATGATRAEADRYAEETRSNADQEAARIVEDARRSADQTVDEAERQATARRREAEALYEQQRAKAAKAAADFEQTLAERRDTAERAFAERTEAAEKQIIETEERIERLRTDSERAMQDATRRAAAHLEEAEQKAKQIVEAATSRADRVRAESERELAAAMQRRDSINAQLSNVRQMLATLSGTAPAALGLVEDGDAAPAAAEAK
jgi:cell division septum initiation protein DivIVA